MYTSNSVTPTRATPSSSSGETPVGLYTDSASESRRLLELELMHRWSTTTYKSICALPEDEPCIQVDLPRWALKYEFLLHGIFAMSALETALCAGPDMDEAESAMYIRAAMEYYDKGSGAFRAQLLDVSPENIHSVYMFSNMAMAINMALSQCVQDGDNDHQQERMLGRVTILLELLLGSSSIAMQHMDWLLDGPISSMIIRAGMQIMPAMLQPIDDSTDAALERLTSVVSRGVFVSDDGQAAKNAASDGLEAYKNAVVHLRMCFSVDINSQMNGFCVAFPPLAGRDFTLGVKSLEPVALFILLHWAVLLQRLGDWMWWAGSVGRNLVMEISDVLVREHSQLAATPEWRDGIRWAREQVGLQRQR